MRDTQVTRSPETRDRWVVMCPNGDTRAVTVDELDEDFNAGRIDGATLVLAPGDVFWTPLAQIAGLDEAEAMPAAPPAPLAPPPRMIPSEPPSYDALANMAFDVDVDLDGLEPDFAFSPKRRWRRALALPGALAVVAAIVFAISGSVSGSPEATAAAAEPPRAAAPLPSPPPNAEPAPASKPTVLSDDQKRALAAKDKKHDQAKKAKTEATRAAAPKPRASAAKSSSPFSKGGDPHDPLNAKL